MPSKVLSSIVFRRFENDELGFVQYPAEDRSDCSAFKQSMCTYARLPCNETFIVSKYDWLNETVFLDGPGKLRDMRKVPPNTFADDDFVDRDFDRERVKPRDFLVVFTLHEGS